MSLSPELEALRDSVRSALVDQADDSARLYKTLVGIGVVELAQPEIAIVLEELGRALYAGPVLCTSLAAIALEKGLLGAEHVSDLTSGALTAGLALVQPGTESGVEASDATLSGTASFVLDGCTAALLLVEVLDAGEAAIYLVEPDAPGVERVALPSTDLRREIAEVTFAATPARLVGGADFAAAISRAATVSIACEQVGGAAAALDSAVEYSKIRTQFGRQIGSFQSIKHLAADMFVAVESARAAVGKAAEVLAEDGDELALYVSLAKAAASDAYVQCAEANVQIHGGIGFTWEHSAHLHLRRAKSTELLFGDAAFHRSTLADILGI